MGDVFGKDEAKSPAANAQSRLAQQLYQQTDPLRQGLINRSSNFIGAPAAVPGVGGGFGKDGGGTIGGALGGAMPGVSGGAPGAPGASPMNLTTASPTYLAFKDTADRNFAKAKDNAIARLPGGGALSDALVGLEGQRAGDLTQAAGNIYENELARAMTLATGSTGQSFSGLGQAGNTQAMLAQANAEQNAGKSSALGSGIGAMIGLKAA